jgi:hypothetical protein
MRRKTSSREFRVGDWVIYCVTKQTPHPGPRARMVSPARAGDLYAYAVEKQWIVAQVQDDGRLLLSTRRGKQRLVSASDPALRRPSLWERWWLRNRFPRGESERSNPRKD